MKEQGLVLLELNEVNFDFVKWYCSKGLLPNFAEMLQRNGLAYTTSESSYELLEPWIQWVTAHTGQEFLQHKVFRLGDIVDGRHRQIWEHLESQGLRVGAVSPMNAANRTAAPAFFVPDPWTPTAVTAPSSFKRFFAAVKQVVNENAQSKIRPVSAFWLLFGLFTYARPGHYPLYFKLLWRGVRHSWARAALLDLLLVDVFLKFATRTRLDFSSLFLNAGAHIQHHYMFSSAAYQGECRNPEWYASKKHDPLYEVYDVYDRALATIRGCMPEARIFVATGLHQQPHERLTYYWRLKEHSAFLSMIGVPLRSVEPRMSRDFVVRCRSVDEAQQAASIMSAVRTQDGTPLFEVDNRGLDLFIMLTYPHAITEQTLFSFSGEPHRPLMPHVAFVAIKNGEHNGMGYFLDSGAKASADRVQFKLADLPRRICEALGAPVLS